MDLRALGINTHISYDEKLIDNGIINKLYMIDNPQNSLIKGIPDGCIDLQLVKSGDNYSIFLVGSHMQSIDTPIMKNDRVFGVKFQPGTEFIMLNKEKISLTELIDNRCNITDMFKMSKLFHTFHNNGSLQELQDIFLTDYGIRDFHGRNYMLSFLLGEVEKKHGNLNITNLSEETGYSQRYVNKICKDKLGFSLKRYANIIRMQYALEFIHKKSDEETYELLGYYDQAHYIRDFKNFTSLTPNKYQKMRTNFYYV